MDYSNSGTALDSFNRRRVSELPISQPFFHRDFPALRIAQTAVFLIRCRITIVAFGGDSAIVGGHLFGSGAGGSSTLPERSNGSESWHARWKTLCDRRIIRAPSGIRLPANISQKRAAQGSPRS